MKTQKINITDAKLWACSHKVLCVLMSLLLVFLLVPTAAISYTKAFADQATPDTEQNDQATDQSKGGEKESQDSEASPDDTDVIPDSDVTPVTPTDEDEADDNSDSAPQGGSSSHSEIEADNAVSDNTNSDVEDANEQFNFRVYCDPSADIWYSREVEDDEFTIEGNSVLVYTSTDEPDHLIMSKSYDNGESYDDIILYTYWSDQESTEMPFAYWTIDDQLVVPDETMMITDSNVHAIEPHYVSNCQINGKLINSSAESKREVAGVEIQFKYGNTVRNATVSNDDGSFSLDVPSGRTGDLYIGQNIWGRGAYKILSLSRDDLSGSTCNLGDLDISEKQQEIELYSLNRGWAQFVMDGETYPDYHDYSVKSNKTITFKKTDNGDETFTYTVDIKGYTGEEESEKSFTVNIKDGYKFKWFEYADSIKMQYEIIDFSNEQNEVTYELSSSSTWAEINLAVESESTDNVSFSGKVVDYSAEAYTTIAGAYVSFWDNDSNYLGYARSQLNGDIEFCYEVESTVQEISYSYEIKLEDYDWYRDSGNQKRNETTGKFDTIDLGQIRLTKGKTAVASAYTDVNGGYFIDDHEDQITYIASDMMDVTAHYSPYYYIEPTTNKLTVTDENNTVQYSVTPKANKDFVFDQWMDSDGNPLTVNTKVYITGDVVFHASFNQNFLLHGYVESGSSRISGAQVSLYTYPKGESDVFNKESSNRPAALTTYTNEDGYYKFDSNPELDGLAGFITVTADNYIPVTVDFDKLPFSELVNASLDPINPDTIPVMGVVMEHSTSGEMIPVQGAYIQYWCDDDTTKFTDETFTNDGGSFSCQGGTSFCGMVLCYDKPGGTLLGSTCLSEVDYDDDLHCLIAFICTTEVTTSFTTTNGGIFYYKETYPQHEVDGYTSIYTDHFESGCEVEVSGTNNSTLTIDEDDYSLEVSCEDVKAGLSFTGWSYKTISSSGEAGDWQPVNDNIKLEKDKGSYVFQANIEIDKDTVCGRVVDTEGNAIENAAVMFDDEISSLSLNSEKLNAPADLVYTDTDGWYMFNNVSVDQGVITVGKKGYYPASCVVNKGTVTGDVYLIDTLGENLVCGTVYEMGADGSHHKVSDASITYVCNDEQSTTNETKTGDNGEYSLIGGSSYDCIVYAESTEGSNGYVIGNKNMYIESMGVQLINIVLNQYSLGFVVNDENAGNFHVVDVYGQREHAEDTTSFSHAYAANSTVSLGDSGVITINDNKTVKHNTTVTPVTQSGYEFDGWVVYDVKSKTTTILEEGFVITGDTAPKVLVGTFSETEDPQPPTPVNPDSDTTTPTNYTNTANELSSGTSSSSTSDNLFILISALAGVALLGAGAVYFARRKKEN